MISILNLLLAAGPRTTVVGPVADPLTPLYILVGTSVVAQIVAGVIGIVKWMGTRTVEREDKDKEELQKRLDEHDSKFEETERAVSAVDRTLGNMQNEMKQVLDALGGTKTTVNEIRNTMETTRDKQSQFYREQIKELTTDFEKALKELEYKLRQDMSRAVHDATVLKGRKRS